MAAQSQLVTPQHPLVQLRQLISTFLARNFTTLRSGLEVGAVGAQGTIVELEVDGLGHGLDSSISKCSGGLAFQFLKQ